MNPILDLLNHVLGGYLIAGGDILCRNHGLLASGSSGHSQCTAHSSAALLFAADNRCVEAEGRHIAPVHPVRLGYVLPQKMVKAKVRTIPEGFEIFCAGVGEREELRAKEGTVGKVDYKTVAASEWPLEEMDVFEDSGVHLMPHEIDGHSFKYLGHYSDTSMAASSGGNGADEDLVPTESSGSLSLLQKRCARRHAGSPELQTPCNENGLVQPATSCGFCFQSVLCKFFGRRAFKIWAGGTRIYAKERAESFGSR